jgi:hypothetical protein
MMDSKSVLRRKTIQMRGEIRRLEKRIAELEGVILRAADALRYVDDSGLHIDVKVPLADLVGVAEEIVGGE